MWEPPQRARSQVKDRLPGYQTERHNNGGLVT
jgi:hypothetical protein